jgi:hypothetical protein
MCSLFSSSCQDLSGDARSRHARNRPERMTGTMDGSIISKDLTDKDNRLAEFCFSAAREDGNAPHLPAAVAAFSKACKICLALAARKS